jgi:predicted transcriptional regulator
MVDAISSAAASTLLSSSSSASGAASSTADIEAQITAKQDELASETDAQKKAEIEQAIAALKAQLEAAQAAEKLKTTAKGGELPPPAQLSGESAQIGTANFDENTPFGERTAWL